jgi:hypothetical protein
MAIEYGALGKVQGLPEMVESVPEEIVSPTIWGVVPSFKM